MTNDILRFATAGSVDDGKSTLIGRLLYDSKSIFEDQLDAVERTSVARGEEQTNLALLTDGLRAEREQGITIDVAYRYFATPRRKFIIADTPGHPQYTRNMVTGASTANLALILVDARNGIVEQSRRHAFLSSLLGIPHLVLCVNKMDLVDWSEDAFETIKEEFVEFATRLRVRDLSFIPISAGGLTLALDTDPIPFLKAMKRFECGATAGERHDRARVTLEIHIRLAEAVVGERQQAILLDGALELLERAHVLLADQTHRNNPAIGIDEALAEDCLQHEYPLGMVPQRAVPRVCQDCLGLVEPLVQREIVIDRAAPFSDRREGVVVTVGHARSPRARSSDHRSR